MRMLLLKGIAIHHSDIIPFVREVVEIIYSKGLIKILFATETFAMGINMPSKTGKRRNSIFLFNIYSIKLYFILWKNQMESVWGY